MATFLNDISISLSQKIIFFQCGPKIPPSVYIKNWNWVQTWRKNCKIFHLVIVNMFSSQLQKKRKIKQKKLMQFWKTNACNKMKFNWNVDKFFLLDEKFSSPIMLMVKLYFVSRICLLLSADWFISPTALMRWKCKTKQINLGGCTHNIQ